MTRQEMFVKATQNKADAIKRGDNAMTLEECDSSHAAYCLACNDLESIRLNKLHHVSFNKTKQGV